MSSVYTNLAKKRIEQSQESSQNTPKATEPQKLNSSIPQSKNQSVEQPSSQTQQQKEEKQIAYDTMIPRHHDTTTPISHDTTTPFGNDLFETVRKSVKQIGKEAATHRFTLNEKNDL